MGIRCAFSACQLSALSFFVPRGAFCALGSSWFLALETPMTRLTKGHAKGRFLLFGARGAALGVSSTVDSRLPRSLFPRASPFVSSLARRGSLRGVRDNQGGIRDQSH